MPAPAALLCRSDHDTFWPWYTWSDFAQWPEKEGVEVIVPLAGYTDWGLGHAYDSEEQVLLSVLAEAMRELAVAGSPRRLVIPPLRFLLGPSGKSAFAVTPPEAIRLWEEVVGTIAASGFRRVILYNASPWNEELVDAVARDLRIEQHLQMFCVNLSALDLDFHPVRSRSRRSLQTLLTYLNGKEPEAPQPSPTSDPVVLTSAPRWGVDVFPVLTEPAASWEQAQREGPEILASAARHLASLLREIAARPPLPNQGAIIKMTVP